MSSSSPSSPPPKLEEGAAASRRMGDDEDGLNGGAGPALIQGWYHLGLLCLTKPFGGEMLRSVSIVGCSFLASSRV